MDDETRRIGGLPEPPPDVNLADLQDIRRRGKHRNAETEPSTGPLYKIPVGPRGRHQEHDLEPKRWPWAIGTTILALLVSWASFSWGHAPVNELEAELASRPEYPVATATVTEPAPRPQKAPSPAPTVTVTREVQKGKKPAPAPTVTAWRTAPASPAPTVFRDRPVEGPTIYRTREVPGPTVYRTREVRVEICYRYRTRSETWEVITCP